jgi:hypothetical protein
MTYTLAAMQRRRTQALMDGDLAAYAAFDMLICEALGVADLCAKHSHVLADLKKNIQEGVGNEHA